MRGALLGPATFFCAAGGATAAVWPKIYGDIIRRRSEGEEEEGRPAEANKGRIFLHFWRIHITVFAGTCYLHADLL